MAEPIISPEDLQRLDDEFIAEYEAGKIHSLDLPPIDPEADLSDQNYAWLTAPSHPYDAAFDALVGKAPPEWYELGGDALRRVVLGGSIAWESDEKNYLKWAQEDFKGICIASGEDGNELIDMLSSGYSGMCRDTVYEVATMLETQAGFSDLTSEHRVIAAMIALNALLVIPADGRLKE